MSAERPEYISQKEDFLIGLAVKLRSPGMDYVDSFGLFRSKTGEYYVEHREQRIFKDERGFRGKSEYSNLGLQYIPETEATDFMGMCLSGYPKIKDVEFLPYAERY